MGSGGTSPTCMAPMTESRISGAEDPSAMSDRLAIVGFQTKKITSYKVHGRERGGKGGQQ